MSLNNNFLIALKLNIRYVFLAFMLTIFIFWQIYFFGNVFNFEINFPTNIKNLFSKSILPNGFCKDCNVILISLDTLRAKSLPCYGYEKNTAPILCDFTKKAFLFTNAYSPSPRTLDSHFSIFTSLYPQSHKMTVPFTSNLGSEILTLTQVLKQSGYVTSYLGPSADPNLPLKLGLGRGFDSISGGGDAVTWIAGLNRAVSQNKKFFAFLHTYWVHEPYIPARENISRFYAGRIDNYISWSDLCEKTYEKLVFLHPDRFRSKIEYDTKQINYCEEINSYGNEYAYSISYAEHEQFYSANIDTYWDGFANIEINEKKVYMQALYETRINELDQEIKRLINFLENENLLRNTIVIITADHGEEFYEHGFWSHGGNLYNEVIKVPLIIYIPNSKAAVIDKLASGIDIAPSILQLLNLQVPPQFVGINLFSDKNKKFVISQNYNVQKHSIISKDWKLLINNDNSGGRRTRELYSLKTDPDEQNNLEEKNNNFADQLEQKLQEIISDLPRYEKNIDQPFPSWIDEEQRRRLIETGYF